MKNLMMKKRDGSLTEGDRAQLESFKNERKAASEQMKLTVMALLTPEQTAKLATINAEREKRTQERRQTKELRKQQTLAPKDNK